MRQFAVDSVELFEVVLMSETSYLCPVMLLHPFDVVSDCLTTNQEQQNYPRFSLVNIFNSNNLCQG